MGIQEMCSPLYVHAEDYGVTEIMNSFYNQNNHFITVTAFYAISLTEFHMPVHTHQSCEIMYVTNGSCTIQGKSQEMILRRNEFVFLDSQVPHRLYIPQGQPCSVLNLEFLCRREETPVNLDILRAGSPDFVRFCSKQMPYVMSNDLRNLGYALKDFITHLQKNSEEPDYLFSLLFQRVMLEVSYCVNQNKKATGMYYLKKACAYIEEHLFEPVKVPELAAYTGIHKSYLQLLFSRFLHSTVTDYVNQRRMEQAVFLLINSSMSIIDIAFSTGYNSRQHFSHTFEKYYGMSPGKYRKLHLRTLVPDTGENQYLLEDGSRRTNQILIRDSGRKEGEKNEFL